MSERILIAGFGDVAQRLVPLLGRYTPIFALVRREESAREARGLGVSPILADLTKRATLARIAIGATTVFHFAPPPQEGWRDTHTRNLLAALARCPPRKLIYISTTGVYGDCAGEVIDETRALNPTSARAVRRVDAEHTLRAWGRHTGVCVCILRAPGIYAADRLPIERIKRGTPTLIAADDVFTNHIHADDLARAALAACRYGRENRAYNIVDDGQQKMADYIEMVADHFALPRPPRVARAEAERTISPMMMSFLRESRVIGNARMKRELKLKLRYPRVRDFLQELPKAQ